MLRRLIPPDADWVVHEPIEMKRPRGSGAFATVYEAYWKGSLVAAKKLHDILFNPDIVPEQQRVTMLEEFVRECSMQAKMRHPNIVQLYGVYIPDGDGHQPPIMLCELMAETLHARLQRDPRLTLRDVIDLALQIASGLRFLHERTQPISHRNLSANNVLLSATGVCKIGDVGIAKVFTPAAQATTLKPGTLLYMPSEVLMPGGQHNEKLDVFSLGVLMLEMLLGHEPRPSPEYSTQVQVGGVNAFVLVAETQRRQAELNELGADHPLRPLVERLLQPQESRPAICEVYEALKQVEASHHYVSSASTLAQAGGGTNMSPVLSQFSGDLLNIMKSIEEISRWQMQASEQLQGFVTSQAELQEQMTATQQQLRNVTQQQQQAATQLAATQQQLGNTTQQLQNVQQQQQRAVTQQQLQQNLNRLERDAKNSTDQRMAAITAEVTKAVQDLNLPAQARAKLHQDIPVELIVHQPISC